MNESVLLVDDDPSVLRSLVRGLNSKNDSYKKHTAGNPVEAITSLKKYKPLVCVLDLQLESKLGTTSGISLISKLLEIDPQLKIIVLTGHSSEELGIKALNHGATTYITKPCNSTHLNVLIEDSLITAKLKKKYLDLVKESNPKLKGLETHNKEMREIISEINFISTTTQSTLITGETGVGKGVVAEAIHRLSPHSDGAFVRFQPANDDADLVASELFGHVRGSFTGANSNRIGLVEEAHNGTLFIDEIAELPERIQLMLLNVLQEKKYRKIGSNRNLISNFRLISATNRTSEEISKLLRKDFYHRIARFRIHLPKLKDRTEDIPFLAKNILNNFSRREKLSVYDFSPAALSWIMKYPWPGNIRELEAKVEIASQKAAYSKRSFIDKIDFEDSKNNNSISTNCNQPLKEVVKEFKYNYIMQALETNQNNKSKTAKMLSIQRSTLCNILNENG